MELASYYSPQSIAYIFIELNLSIEDEFKMIDEIYELDALKLLPQYRKKKKKFLQKLFLCEIKLLNSKAISHELPRINQDILDSNEKVLAPKVFTEDIEPMDLLFQKIRLQLLFLDKDSVRMKMRTIMKFYGKKRMSENFYQHLNSCLRFYRLDTYSPSTRKVKIESIGLDKMVFFKLKK